MMTTVLTISVLSLIFLLLAAIRLHRPQPHSEDTVIPFPRPRPRALFSEPDEASARRLQLELEAEAQQSQRSALRLRAAQGDLSALHEAHLSGDGTLYRETLNALVTVVAGSSDAAERLHRLASYIAQSKELRASKELAAEMIALWQLSPGKAHLGEMLHIAALADDAATYKLAVELAVEKWKDGSLADVSATYLTALLESEFWVIGAEARKAGASFTLKKALSNVRRELAAAQGQKR
ncbi:MAG TPA: hypothetical protein VNQ79_00015 [Blastocatellia bacterium]|nr:hypothetical protein [Blastocatellia bacterium]